MIPLAPLLAAALAAPPAPDPCAAVVPAAEPDPAAAAEYRAVAEAEQAAGRTATEAAAWRAAAEADPGDGVARAALAALCRASTAGAAFARGLAEVNAGRCAAALAPLEEARAGGDRAAALLAGICRYEAGDDGAAAALLEEAAQDPGARPQARFFLGLLALRRGEAGSAVALLDAASGDPGLAPLAAQLGRTARRSGRLVLSLALESGWDSNVDLSPGLGPAPSGASDGTSGLAAGLTFAPRGERGPYARAAASATELWTTEDYDLAAASVAAGWQLARGARAGLVELGWDHRRLGEAPLLWSLRALASGQAPLGRGLLGTLSWQTARDEELQASRDAHGGWRHELEAELAGELRGVGVAAAWRAGYDGAKEDSLAAWETGPRLTARGALSRRVRAELELGWTWRRAGATDPVLGKRQEDQLYDAAAALEVELGARLALRVACAARRASSNVGELTHSRVVPSVGLTYVRGLR